MIYEVNSNDPKEGKMCIRDRGIVVNKAVTFPELCHNGISGDCFSGMFQKYLQNAEFVFRKVNIMTVPGPVSYTHLDVYKRQTCTGRSQRIFVLYF